MKKSLTFVSTCPSCREHKLQYGYTRRALTSLIESRQIIDAYCLECDVVWPVTPEERTLIAGAITTGQNSIDTMQQRPEAAHR